MSNFVIITDSSSDLPAKVAESFGVTVIPLEVNIDDIGCKMNDEIDIKEFYAWLRDKKGAKTSAVNMDRFSEIFENFAKEGKDVLYIGFSSGLSATFMAGKNAAEEVCEKYPDRKLIAVDSLCASLGQGLIVKLAVDKKNSGATIEEVAAYVEEIKPNLCHWFTVEDLFFLKRGGRVSAATAVMGTVLQIKPVMHVDDAGKLVKVSTARGRKASIDALFAKIKDTATDVSEQTVFISHGDCIEDAKYLAEKIKSELGVKEVIISYVGPVIGAHSGPGTLALFFMATKR